MELKNILSNYWGRTSFKENQESILYNLINGKSIIADYTSLSESLLSYLIYSIKKKAITLIFFQEINYFNKQFEFLKNKNIAFTIINKYATVDDLEIVITTSKFSRPFMLFIDIDFIKTNNFYYLISQINFSLSVFYNSELISNDYKNSKAFIDKFLVNSKEKQFLFYSNLKKKSLSFDYINIDSDSSLIKSYKNNLLSHSVIEKEDINFSILSTIKKLKLPTILYAKNRKKCREISNYLNENGIKSKIIHQGVYKEYRKKYINEFHKNNFRVLVLTSQVKIDFEGKNLRIIIHSHVPESIDLYFSNVNKLSLNKNYSYSFIFYSKNDFEINTNKKHHNLTFIKNLYVKSNKLINKDFDIVKFSNSINQNIADVHNGLTILNNLGLINYSTEKTTKSSISLNLSKDELYDFRIKNLSYDSFLKYLLDEFKITKDFPVSIDENKIANHLNLTLEKTTKIIKDLHEKDLLQYKLSKNSFYIEHIKENNFDEHQIENYINSQKNVYANNLEKIYAYLTNNSKCRTQLINEYFGHNNTKKCKICDNCLNI
ncbi:RecQ family zinc-binding domain-containing protein [Bacteroidota bacterium]|nr:RecQ family zinc-binding domain-containing protein [Bacteroidota bacterium]